MPRRKVIHGSREVYRGYGINKKYNYDGRQLDTIIDALEYYKRQSVLDISSDYVVFEITLNVDETTRSPMFNPEDYDDGCTDLSSFNPNSLKSVLPADQFYYRWTREYKEDHFMGEHYHLMVIANHFPLRDMMTIQKAVANLQGVKTAFISPRVLPENDHRSKVHFHWLNRNRDGVDGIEDAVLRHCYKAKLDQKLEGMGRSFDGSRELTPLVPISRRNQELFVKSTTATSISIEDTASSSLFHPTWAVVAGSPQTIVQEPF